MSVIASLRAGNVTEWLAALGALTLVDGLELSWTGQGQSVFHDSQAFDRIHEALMTQQNVDEWPIAVDVDGLEPVALWWTVGQYEERASRFRGHPLGWMINALYAPTVDGQDPRTERTKSGQIIAGPQVITGSPWLVGVPAGVPPARRLEILYRSMGEIHVADALGQDSLGCLREGNGLGFNPDRLPGAADSGNPFVNPVVEILAFFGLRWFPAAMAWPQQDLTQTAGWDVSAWPHRFTYRTWAQPLNGLAFDAMRPTLVGPGTLDDSALGLLSTFVATKDRLGKGKWVISSREVPGQHQLQGAFGRLAQRVKPLLPADKGEVVARHLCQVAPKLADQLTQEMDARLRSEAAVSILNALFGGDPPPNDWWATPLGQECARSLPSDTAHSWSHGVAAAHIGVTRGTIGKLVERGKLDRHPDGGLVIADVIAEADRRS